MSTRSLIGRKLEDGKIEFIYCHWDGYPKHNGKILLNHYTDDEKIKELINLGDLSSLAEEIGEKHDFDAKDIIFKWCMAYGRDRGELNTEKRIVNSLDNFLGIDSWQDFYYLYQDNEWYFSSFTNRRNFIKVKDYLNNNKEK